MSPVPPELSAVVVTDSYRTIAPLVATLAAQAGPKRIELVAVAESGAPLEPGSEADRLGGYVPVRVDSVENLRDARVQGFEAASAPVVLLAETHCFPRSGWLDATLAAHREGWAVVGPRIENANPQSALSWATFIDHYGRFSGEQPRRAAAEVCGHNSSYGRRALLALGADLGVLLRDFPALQRRLGAERSVLFEPAARMAHVNTSRMSGFVAEALIGGRVAGSCRAESWSWRRRLGYALATPLIAAVELARRVGPLRRNRAAVPAGTLPLLALAIALRCVGEAAGFLLGSSGKAAERTLTKTEINRSGYVREADRALLESPTAESRQPASTAAAGDHS